jgi:hypothetical protein
MDSIDLISLSDSGRHEMPGSNPHDAHGDATLSISEVTTGGGQLFQSWTICACTLSRLRDRLGPPHHESYATPEAARAIAEAALHQPGNVHVR